MIKKIFSGLLTYCFISSFLCLPASAFKEKTSEPAEEERMVWGGNAVNQVQQLLHILRVEQDIRQDEIDRMAEEEDFLYDQLKAFLNSPDKTSQEAAEDNDVCNYLLAVEAYWAAYTLSAIRPLLRDVRRYLIGEMVGGGEGESDSSIREIRQYMQYARHLARAVLRVPVGIVNIILTRQQYQNCQQ
jgi:hypothetical protein